jgi:hypothetical protein
MSTPPKPKPRPPSNDERDAAYREYNKMVSAAWEADPEFGNVLNLAITVGVTEPFADYIDQRRLTDEQRHTLAAWIRSLSRKQKRKGKGRPRKGTHQAKPKYGPVELKLIQNAEHRAACIVEGKKIDWRKQHGRERVPGSETTKMIDNAIKQVAKSFGIDESKISESNVRIAMQTGRIKTG